MCQEFKVRPRTGWRYALGWDQWKVAQEFMTVNPDTRVDVSRVSRWESWPLAQGSSRPSLRDLAGLALTFGRGCTVAHLVDEHDAAQFSPADLLLLGAGEEGVRSLSLPEQAEQRLPGTGVSRAEPDVYEQLLLLLLQEHRSGDLGAGRRRAAWLARRLAAAARPEVLGGPGGAAVAAGLSSGMMAASGAGWSGPVVISMDTAPSLSAEVLAAIATGDGLMEHLGGALSRIAVDYLREPFMPLFAELVQVRDAVFDSLHEHQGQSRDRFFLAGTTSLLLAYTLQDLGQDDLALAELRTARLCADHAGHPGLLTWALIDGAMMVTDQVAPSQAALRSASMWSQQAAAAAPPGDLRIRTAVIGALAAARAGDSTSARSALVRLAEARAQTPVHDETLQLGGRLTYPTAKQDVGLGRIYTLLQNYEAAYAHSSAAIIAYQSGPAEQRAYTSEAASHINLMNVGILVGAFDDDVDRAFQYLVDLPAGMRNASLGNAMERVEVLACSTEHKNDRVVRRLGDTVRDYRASGVAGSEG
jgi:hypothetical protein